MLPITTIHRAKALEETMKRKGTIDPRYPIDYADLWELAKDVQAIAKDYRPDDLRESKDDNPCITLTIGFDCESWSYQTGDNSYHGAAYGYPLWAVTYVPRTGALGDCVRDLADQIQGEY